MERGELTVYSAFVPSLPLSEAARLFESDCGIGVRVHSGRPEHWMEKVRVGAPADVLCCGAEFLLDIAERQGLVDGGTRRSVGRRHAALVVPEGNPADVRDLRDLVRPALRIGIASEGCTLGLWDELCARSAIPSEAVRGNIREKAPGCGALIGVVAKHGVDVAVGWHNFDRVPESRVAVVELPPALSILRSTGVAVAVSSHAPLLAMRFVDFLRSAHARDIYARWGWEP